MAVYKPIKEQLEVITNNLDDFLENDLRQLFYRKSHKMKKDAVSIIKEAPRVDTGRMWKTITSFVTIENSKLGITLFSNAHERGKDSYSSYQNFGTSKISGIYFVTNAFHNNINGIEKEIDTLLKEKIK